MNKSNHLGQSLSMALLFVLMSAGVIGLMTFGSTMS